MSRAIRVIADDSKIVGFSITPSIDEAITNKYEFVYYLVKFAQEEEREACAKVCEDTDIVEFQHCMVLHEDAAKTLRNAAAAIRARSHVQQEPQSKD